MDRFVLIARGLDPAAALAELAALPEIYWTAAHGQADQLVPLLGPDGRRRQLERLASVWALIEAVHAQAARAFGDKGEIDHARVGRLPPGGRVAPHSDGHDGTLRRRYQIMLATGPMAEIVVDGESRNLRPGEAWQLDSARLHWAVNHDPVPRVNILFDSRAAA